MEILTKTDVPQIFYDKKLKLGIYLDKKSNLLWSYQGNQRLPLSELPWNYQKF
ncbi:hypothetical protein MNBD_BACTEROID03-2475, partial [hydrothermal vent metagenome]